MWRSGDPIYDARCNIPEVKKMTSDATASTDEGSTKEEEPMRETASSGKRSAREVFEEQVSKKLALMDIPATTRTEEENNNLRQVNRYIDGEKHKFPEVSVKRPSKAKSGAERKVAQRAKKTSEEQENERAATRKRVEEVRAGKTSEEIDKARETNKQQVAIHRAAMTTERKEKEKEAAKERMSRLWDGKTQEEQEKQRQVEKERKAEERLSERDIKVKEKQWPQQPVIKCTSARERSIQGPHISTESCRPTSCLGEEVELMMAVNCFPPPIFKWTTSGGKEFLISGGTARERMKGVDTTDREELCPDQELPRDFNSSDFRGGTYWFFERSGEKGPELARQATSTLTIKKSRLQDAGHYTVSATNAHGSVSFTWFISFKPTMVEDISCTKPTVRSGYDTISLSVEISGGRVEWLKDNTPIKSEPRQSSGRQVCINHEEKSCLKIKECRKEDEGTYMAKVENPLGQVISSPCVVRVIPGPKPSTDTRTLEEKLRHGWRLANSLLCMYCHEICTSTVSKCEFCERILLTEYSTPSCQLTTPMYVEFEGKKVLLQNFKIWNADGGKNHYICSNCKEKETCCRFCRRRLAWEWDWTEGGKHGMAQNLETIDISEKLKHLAEVERKLQEADAPSVWEYENTYTGSTRKLLGDKEERERRVQELDGEHDPDELLRWLGEMSESKKRWEKEEEERIMESRRKKQEEQLAAFTLKFRNGKTGPSDW